MKEKFEGKDVKYLTKAQRKRWNVQKNNQRRWENTDREMEKNAMALKCSPANFYNSPEWLSLRYRALKEMGARCMLCGATPRTGAQIHVDHIKPRSIYPELAFDINNLQILCRACNMGKLNKDFTDWRNGGAPISAPIFIVRHHSRTK
jgi:5-methylcytosine-specific restriction endonuclease McrA